MRLFISGGNRAAGAKDVEDPEEEFALLGEEENLAGMGKSTKLDILRSLI